MKNFVLDGRYEELLTHYNLNVEEALKKADLPEDTLKKLHPTMNEQEYYNFLEAIGSQIQDEFTPIKIATTSQIESFSPPQFLLLIAVKMVTYLLSVLLSIRN